MTMRKADRRDPYLDNWRWLLPRTHKDSLAFWEDRGHNKEAYKPFINELRKRDRGKVDLIIHK